MPTVAALIVAAGRGERAPGAVPKQFRPLLGASALRRCVKVFVDRSDISLVQVVIDERYQELAAHELTGLRRLPFVHGGATRQESVRNGLAELVRHAPDFVLIHDAARPLVSPDLIRRVIDALTQGATACAPLLPLTDTLKQQMADRWTTLTRDGLFRAQTPQGFRFEAILNAHRAGTAVAATDDIALAEAAGFMISVVPGEESNIKITDPADFPHAERILAGAMTEFRTGYGVDAHRFAAGQHVWLCGIKLASEVSLVGHSDADAGLHALTDAVLGAIGAGDIGGHFSPLDSRWKGAPSAVFLAHAVQLVHDAGGSIVHCDVTLICEQPRISPHREAMRSRIAEIAKIGSARVSVKATTTDGMGFVGRREGLMVHAVVTVRLPVS